MIYRRTDELIFYKGLALLGLNGGCIGVKSHSIEKYANLLKSLNTADVPGLWGLK